MFHVVIISRIHQCAVKLPRQFVEATVGLAVNEIVNSVS